MSNAYVKKNSIVTNATEELQNYSIYPRHCVSQETRNGTSSDLETKLKEFQGQTLEHHRRWSTKSLLGTPTFRIRVCGCSASDLAFCWYTHLEEADGPNAWTAVDNVEDLGGLPGSTLQPRPALGFMGICGVNQWTENLCLLSPFVTLP